MHFPIQSLAGNPEGPARAVTAESRSRLCQVGFSYFFTSYLPLVDTAEKTGFGANVNRTGTTMVFETPAPGESVYRAFKSAGTG